MIECESLDAAAGEERVSAEAFEWLVRLQSSSASVEEFLHCLNTHLKKLAGRIHDAVGTLAEVTFAATLFGLLVRPINLIRRLSRYLVCRQNPSQFFHLILLSTGATGG